jgi:hypothetical protein
MKLVDPQEPLCVTLSIAGLEAVVAVTLLTKWGRLAALAVCVPPQSPSINPLFPGIELWLNGSTVISLPMVSNGESIREPLWGLAGLPNGSWDISIQYVVFLPQSVCGNASFTYSASPALIISW